jgi:hypothetical protein
MMTSITLQNAIELAPAIGATSAGDNTNPNTYQFISTRKILEGVLDRGWSIVDAVSSGKTLSARHKVTLVRTEDLLKYDDTNSDGLLRLEILNSHNLTKRFMSCIGYYRWACSNGLIASYGPVESIRTKHRFSDDRLERIQNQIQEAAEHFPVILNQIENFKQREMKEEEQLEYAKFAIKGRYLYRKQLPKTFINLEKMAEKMLDIRRSEDEGNRLWAVYNRVQENMIRGIEGVTRPVKAFDDSFRVNRLLWKGAETSLKFDRSHLTQELNQLLLKNKTALINK